MPFLKQKGHFFQAIFGVDIWNVNAAKKLPTICATY